MRKVIALIDTDGLFYAHHGLDVTAEASGAMKFDNETDAARVNKNLNDRFTLHFYTVTLVGEEFGSHGVRWHLESCELCGSFASEMEDPTFDASRVLPGGRALWICEPCAKERIESEMTRLGTTVN